ncbi:hypothetical protein M434DRAFT_10478 [Hypoxylon sp. CO27-5]|nr:hypothetical protein M434DRAFT_10478 [Hypoxylon sp. CO27-5]
MSVNDGPIRHLGLECSESGSFYICHDAEVRFIGCCDEDPCAQQLGNCSESNLSPASFDGSKYNDIPTQECVAPFTSEDWHACPDGSFIGCCMSDPCIDGCSYDDLIEARMSDDDTAAAIFSIPGESSVSTRSTSTSSSATSSSISSSTSDTSTPVPTETTPTSSPSPDQGTISEGRNETPISAIIGGTIGGMTALILILSFLFIYFRRRSAAQVRKASATEDPTEPSQAPWDPYKDPGNPGVVQELSSEERRSELPNATYARVSELDSRHTSFSAPDNHLSSNYAQQQHPVLNVVSELEGSIYVHDGHGRQFNELNSGT